MSEQLPPCPFCGDEHPDIVSGDGVMCSAADCYASNMFEQWIRRTPPPATKAMRDWAIRARTIRTPQNQIYDPLLLDAFIAEWKP